MRRRATRAPMRVREEDFPRQPHRKEFIYPLGCTSSTLRTMTSVSATTPGGLYRMVIVGGIISAASVFFMALPPVWFQSLADGAFGSWLGHSYLGLKGGVHPYYVMTAIFVLVILQYEGRRLISLTVTYHPTAQWIAISSPVRSPWMRRRCT